MRCDRLLPSTGHQNVAMAKNTDSIFVCSEIEFIEKKNIKMCHFPAWKITRNA